LRTGAAENNPNDKRLFLMFLREGASDGSFPGQASPTVSRIEAVSASAGVLPAHTTY
jgi:hypothetical protein